jgi:hypothetical protein
MIASKHLVAGCFLLPLVAANGQPLTEAQSKTLIPNSCAIRCPDDTAYEPHAAFTVCSDEQTPICQCRDPNMRMANCESRIATPDSPLEFTDRDGPRHIRFRIFLVSLDRPPPLTFADVSGLDEPAAVQMQTYLMALREEIQRELTVLRRRMLCPTNVPRPAGAEIAPIFSAFDDAEEAVYYKYLAVAVAELRHDQYAQLERMYMDRGGFGGGRVDHHTRDVAELEQTLQRVCDKLDIEDYD